MCLDSIGRIRIGMPWLPISIRIRPDPDPDPRATTLVRFANRNQDRGPWSLENLMEINLFLQIFKFLSSLAIQQRAVTQIERVFTLCSLYSMCAEAWNLKISTYQIKLCKYFPCLTGLCRRLRCGIPPTWTTISSGSLLRLFPLPGEGRRFTGCWRPPPL